MLFLNKTAQIYKHTKPCINQLLKRFSMFFYHFQHFHFSTYNTYFCAQKGPEIQFSVYNRSKTLGNDIRPDINWLLERIWMFSYHFHKQDIYAVALVPKMLIFASKMGPTYNFSNIIGRKLLEMI